MVIIKFVFILVLMLLLLRRKISIGIVLFLSSFLIGLLFAEDKILIPYYFVKSIFSYLTIKLLAIVYSIFLMSSLLKEGDIDKMLKGIINIIPDLRIAAIIPPAIIGFLPMPGGATLSAPIVESIGNKLNIPPEKKVYVNYWYRHIWEYAWPLYPGLILTVSILNIPMRTIMTYQFYLTLIAILTGLFVVLRIKNVDVHKKDMHILKAIFYLGAGIWPILLMIILILLTSFRVEFIVVGSVFLYFILIQINIKKKVKFLFTSLKLETVFLIVGIVLFKDILYNTNALMDFIGAFPESEILSILFIIILPFFIGLLTGINQGYVGIALPVVLPFLYVNGQIDMLKVTVFYATGFAGVLLSPVHLCLLLTVEYFKADFQKVYRYLLPSVIPIFLIPIIIFLLRR